MKTQKLPVLVSYLSIFFAANIAISQDIHFSQIGHSPLNLNSALTAANYDLEAIINYKQQWKSVAQPYKTLGGSVNARVLRKREKKGIMGIGLNFISDKAGETLLKTSAFSVSFAYHLKITKNSTLGASIYGGLNQRSINGNEGQWESQYDGIKYDQNVPNGELFNSDKFGFFDTGGGLVYTYNKNEKYMTGNNQLSINAGIGAFHLNRPQYSFINKQDERLAIRTTYFVSGLIGVGNSDISFAPGVYLNYQGKARELLVGTYLRYMIKEESKYTGFIKSSSVSIGCFYRNKDAIILNLKVEYANYAIGISYDINTSGLKDVSNSRGGTEIFIRYVSPSPFTASKSRI